jgi:hypothetical protein
VGTGCEHERGWRAEFAYPKSLVLLPVAIPFSLSAIESRLATLTAFGTDIFIQDDRVRISLWANGTGYDASGLDYLIGARKAHYVRRQLERTLKRGDRIALLGLGIAVVNGTDSKNVQLVLGNGQMLRIAQKNIVLNEHNMRWECDVKNT